MKVRAYAATVAAGLIMATAGAPAAAAQDQHYVVANLAEQRPTQARAAAGGADAHSGPRICVNAELTGSRLPKRICRTAAEWERMGGLLTN